VYRAAADGDEICAAIILKVGRRIAWAIHLIAMTYDVERVVLGGGVSQAGETFLRPIERELDRLRRSSELAKDQLAPEMVVLLPAGADAGVWGAVTIANTAGLEASRHRAEIPMGPTLAAAPLDRADPGTLVTNADRGEVRR
jgi:glucokinase